ncbi:MAG: sulfurtransferase-like selenium metabolism protein YedF [Synergistaceae bacterium]|nr:sulfurtransferase-like selenium metabolism protein YedF [Synergistaceae bacterium]
MKKIDARGKQCPEPVIMTKTCVDRGEEELEVLLDNPVSATNVRRFLESKGFGVQLRDDEGQLTISARRQVEQAPSEQPDQALIETAAAAVAQASGDWPLPSRAEFAPCPSTKETFSVLITCNILGRNDQQLGEVLMKSFLGTLSQLDEPPCAVALMNEGVKLALYDSSSCDHLKNLVKKDVILLVCGTCVSHFQIAEQIGAGTISNMFEIVETLNRANKILTL